MPLLRKGGASPAPSQGGIIRKGSARGAEDFPSLSSVSRVPGAPVVGVSPVSFAFSDLGQLLGQGVSAISEFGGRRMFPSVGDQPGLLDFGVDAIERISGKQIAPRPLIPGQIPRPTIQPPPARRTPDGRAIPGTIPSIEAVTAFEFPGALASQIIRLGGETVRPDVAVGIGLARAPLRALAGTRVGKFPLERLIPRGAKQLVQRTIIRNTPIRTLARQVREGQRDFEGVSEALRGTPKRVQFARAFSELGEAEVAPRATLLLPRLASQRGAVRLPKLGEFVRHQGRVLEVKLLNKKRGLVFLATGVGKSIQVPASEIEFIKKEPAKKAVRPPQKLATSSRAPAIRTVPARVFRKISANQNIRVDMRDPLGSIHQISGDPITKLSYFGDTDELLLALPGETHAMAISNPKRFDSPHHVRAIVDRVENIVAIRPFFKPDATIKEIDLNLIASTTLAAKLSISNPGIRVVLDVTTDQLTDFERGVDKKSIDRRQWYEVNPEQKQRLVAQTAITRAFSSEKGITVTLAGQEPVTGFVVSPHKGAEVQIPAKQLIPARLISYINQNRALLTRKGSFLGIWEQGGVYFVDAVVVTRELAEALALGEANQQLAVWDIVGKREVLTSHGQAKQKAPALRREPDLAARDRPPSEAGPPAAAAVELAGIPPGLPGELPSAPPGDPPGPVTTPGSVSPPVPSPAITTSPILEEHLEQFQISQLPSTSAIPALQRKIQRVNGQRLSGQLTPTEANQQIAAIRKQMLAVGRAEGIALQMTKGGKVRLAIRQSGVFVPESFASYKNFKDVEQYFGGGEDLTRMIQNIDGAISVRNRINLPGQAGPLEKLVLFRTRDYSMQKIRYVSEQARRVNKILSGIPPNSREDRIITDVLRAMSNADATLHPSALAARGDIGAITTDASLILRAQQLRQFYTNLIDDQNAARALRNQKPIPFRNNYSPEILRDATVWERLGFANEPATKITKADLPDYIVPNKPFNPRELARKGEIPYEFKVTSARGLAENYLVTAGQDIFNTSIIQNNKAFIQQLESMGKTKSAQSLSEWTAEAYGGVKPGIDRTIKVPPKMARTAQYINALRNMAVFPLNFSWSLFTQTSSLAFTFMRYGVRNTLQGGFLWTRSRALRRQTALDYYSHLVKTTPQGTLSQQDAQNLIGQKVKTYRSTMDMVNDASVLFLSEIERFLTGMSIQAARLSGQQRGLEGEALRQFASDGGAKTQSMYNDEDKPRLLRSLLVKTTTPFQTFNFEVVNSLREWAGRTGVPPDDMRERLWWVIRFLAASTAFAAIAKKAANKEVWSWKRPPIPFAEYWLSPIINRLTKEYAPDQGLTSPVRMMTGLAKGIQDVLETGSTRKLRNELLKYGPGIFKVPGGVQISRTVDAIIAYTEGGVYDRKGTQLFELSDLADLSQAVLNGVWATRGGRQRLDPQASTAGDGRPQPVRPETIRPRVIRQGRAPVRPRPVRP